MTVPVKMAMSSSMALQRSPNPGCLGLADIKSTADLIRISIGKSFAIDISAMIKWTAALEEYFPTIAKISWIFETSCQ